MLLPILTTSTKFLPELCFLPSSPDWIVDPESYSLPAPGVASIDPCLLTALHPGQTQKTMASVNMGGGGRETSPHKESIKLKREQGDTMFTHQISKD